MVPPLSEYTSCTWCPVHGLKSLQDVWQPLFEMCFVGYRLRWGCRMIWQETQEASMPLPNFLRQTLPPLLSPRTFLKRCNTTESRARCLDLDLALLLRGMPRFHELFLKPCPTSHNAKQRPSWQCLSQNVKGAHGKINISIWKTTCGTWVEMYCSSTWYFITLTNYIIEISIRNHLLHILPKAFPNDKRIHKQNY